MGEPKNPFEGHLRDKIKEAIRQVGRNPHIPGAILEIDEDARQLLSRIKDKIQVTTPISLEESVSLQDGPNHSKFKDSRAPDLSAISLVLEKKEIPKQFIAHVGGGHEFLEHILECPTCLFDAAAPLWKVGYHSENT